MKHYDLSELITMSQGNTDFVTKMVTVFLETTKESLEEILKHFEKKEIANVAALAHKIKPSIDLMGITELKEVVRTIEKNGRSTGDDLDVLVPQLVSVLRLVFDEMEAEYS
jgi:HPt (histidine-containing phosphotransfer) domain-containing protein